MESAASAEEVVEAAVAAAGDSLGTGDHFARTSVHKATWGIHHQESLVLPELIKKNTNQFKVLGVGNSQKMGLRAGRLQKGWASHQAVHGHGNKTEKGT